MACGCTTPSHINCNVDATVCRNSFVLITANCNGTVADVTNGAYGTVTYDEDLNIFTYTQDVETDGVTDTFVYTCNGEDCIVNLEIETGLQENETFLTLEATSNCAVGTPTYTWTIPDCASIADGYTIHSNPIQVIVQEYDPELPMEEQICIFTVDVCCGGNCNGCCKCDTIEWHPPVCVTECGEDPDCICTEPCYEYNPDTGNCEYICAEDQKCCEIEGTLEEAVEETTIVTAEVLCVDYQVDEDGVLIDLTIDITPIVTPVEYDINNINWYISYPRCTVPSNPCLDYRVCDNIEEPLLILNSDVITGEVEGFISEASFVDGHLIITFLQDYLNPQDGGKYPDTIFLKIAAEIDVFCGSAHHSFVLRITPVDFDCTIIVHDTSVTFLDPVPGGPMPFVYQLCNESIECEEVIGTVNVCQECCDDNDCPSGQLCVEGVCKCPDGVTDPDPITGLCPCPTPLPPCINCIPTTGNPIYVPIGDDQGSCDETTETFNYTTCQCVCAVGFCYQLIVDPITGVTTQSECQVCPQCPNPGEFWYIIGDDGTGTLMGVTCAPCYTCVDNVCIPVTCPPGTIPNPAPGRLNCCITDPCAIYTCVTCPDVDPCGCIDNIETPVCVTCDTIDCETHIDCPYGCLCDPDTAKCNHTPCAILDCADTECLLHPECGCLDNDCVPCDYTLCPEGNECPIGCMCEDGACVDNPCTALLCVGEDCILQPECGCIDNNCVPCSSVLCPEGDECPIGCTCEDGTCVDNPCAIAQCTDSEDLPTYCPVIDGCGCDDERCIPCDTVPCPGGDIDCPYGCHCVDAICTTNDCTVLEIECGLNIVDYTYQFNLLHSLDLDANELTVTVDLATTEWLTDSILAAPLSDILEWELNLSSYEDGYLSIGALNTYIGGSPAIVETTNGIVIDLTAFSYEFIMVRCKVLNTDIGGTPISITYRYQDVDTDIASQWQEALGSICYAAYTIQPAVGIPFDGVTQWYIDYDADEVADLVITPTDPEDSTPVYTGGGSGYEVAFAGNEYLIITCPEAGDYVVTADVNSGECLDVSACGTGNACPCTGSASCETAEVILNSLEGNIWTVGIDFFDLDGVQKQWQCETLSEFQACGGGDVVSSYNTNCGGLLPIEYAASVFIPNQLCCNSDVSLAGTGVAWENASHTDNNDWLGNSTCQVCCCGWAHSGVNIISLDGGVIVAEITDINEAKLCYQINVSGGSSAIDGVCCKRGCVTPPPPVCGTITVNSLEIGCAGGGDDYTLTFDITNTNGDGPYSISIANPATCSGSCDPYSGGTLCDYGCICTPQDAYGTYSCEPIEFSIPLPASYCSVPGIPAQFCTPYESGVTLTIPSSYLLFPITPGEPVTFTITDLTTGCSIEYTDTPACCLNFYPDILNFVCIKKVGTDSILAGIFVFIVGPYSTTYTVEVILDDGSGDTANSMSTFAGLCGTPWTLGAITFTPDCTTGTTAGTGIYVDVPAATGVTFGNSGGDYSNPTDSFGCPNFALLPADLYNYDITVKVYPTGQPSCFVLLTVNDLINMDYSLECGVESANIVLTINDYTPGTLYNVEIQSGCSSGIWSQDNNTITISGCTDELQDVVIYVYNQVDPTNHGTIIVPAAELRAFLDECYCMSAISTYVCSKDELNILITSSTYGVDSDYILYPVNCTCAAVSELAPISFTGPLYSTTFADLGCTVPVGTEYTFNVELDGNSNCNYTIIFDTAVCDPDCTTAPTFTYDCTGGFTFSNVTPGLDTVTFIDYQDGEFPIEENIICPNVGCHEGSGVLWIQYDSGCYYLIGIDNTVHTVSQVVDDLTGLPLDYIQCGEAGAGDSLVLHIEGGLGPFTITSSAGLFAPYTANVSNVDIVIGITNAVAGPSTVTISSDIITCSQTINVDYNCVLVCENSPSLDIQCGGCDLQNVWLFDNGGIGYSVTTRLGSLRATIDGSPAILGATLTPPLPLLATWIGPGGYAENTDASENTDIIPILIDQSTNYNIYVVAPCCVDWELLELNVNGLFVSGQTLGQMSCAQIQALNIDHPCCFCFTATKTGIVNSPTITDNIEYGCVDNTTGAMTWTVAPMELNNITTECIVCDEGAGFSPSRLWFQRVIEYSDGCAERAEAYRLYDSGDSRFYCRLSTLGYFVIELENFGLHPIPSGTVFDLSWTGLGINQVFTALNNCTIDLAGTTFTTTVDVDVEDTISFQVRFNSPACAIRTVEVEITTLDISLNITPIIISKSL